jgi:hypothetical protein
VPNGRFPSKHDTGGQDLTTPEEQANKFQEHDFDENLNCLRCGKTKDQIAEECSGKGPCVLKNPVRLSEIEELKEKIIAFCGNYLAAENICDRLDRMVHQASKNGVETASYKPNPT